jgi:hypothetical protein
VGRVSLRIFLACRQVYQEAASRFLNINTLVFSKVSESWPKRHDSVGKFINLFIPRWLVCLGSQTRFMHKLTTDLDTLCPLGCRSRCGDPPYDDVFSYDSGLIEVHSLLRMIWREALDIEISIIQPHAQAFQDIMHWTEHSRSTMAAFECNIAAITQIVNSLAKGQLGLAKYGRLVDGIGIKRDGSGGAVTWATNHDHGGYAAACVGDLRRREISAYKEYRVEFIAEQGGRQLRMLRSEPRSLLDLPKNVRDNIFPRVITSEEVSQSTLTSLRIVGSSSGFSTQIEQSTGNGTHPSSKTTSSISLCRRPSRAQVSPIAATHSNHCFANRSLWTVLCAITMSGIFHETERSEFWKTMRTMEIISV